MNTIGYRTWDSFAKFMGQSARLSGSRPVIGSLLLTLAALMAATSGASGTDNTWNMSGAAGTTQAWSTAPWSSGMPPSTSSIDTWLSISDGTFLNSYTANNDLGTVTLNRLDVAGSSPKAGLTVSGGTLVFVTNSTGTLPTLNASGSPDLSINNQITATNALTITAGGGKLLLNSGVITDTGGITLNGPGTIQIKTSIAGSGALNVNTSVDRSTDQPDPSFNGVTTIGVGGFLSADRVAALYGGGTLVFNGGLVQVVNDASGASSASTSENFTVTTNGGGIDISSNFSTTGTLTWNGNMTASGTSGSQTFTLSGNGGPASGPAGVFAGALVNGSGTNVTNILKSGTGKWTLSGVNTYTGTTTISAGTLQFAKEVSLYNNGAAATWSASNIVVASGAVAAFNVGGTGEFTSSDIASLAALGTASGGFESGSSIGFDASNAAGGAFTYGGNIVNPNGGANALGLAEYGTGTLVLTGSNSYTGGTVINGGTLQVGNGTSGSNNSTSSYTVAAGANLAFDQANGSTSSRNIANSGTVIGLESSTSTNTLSGAISGTGGFTQSGAGTTILSGPNTFTGATIIQNGAVSVSSLNKVTGGSSTSSLGAPTTVANGTILLGSATTSGTLIDTGTGETSDRVIALAGSTGGGTLDQSGASGNLNLTGGVVSLISSGTSKTLTLQGSTGGTGQISGVISNGLASTTSTAAGAASTGATVIGVNNASTIFAVGAVLSGTGIFAGTTVTAVSGNTVTLSHALSGNVASGETVTITGTNSTTNLFKTGTGAWTLSSANTYTGTTTIENGTLVAGTDSLASTNGAFGNSSLALALGDTTSISSNLSPTLLIGGAFNVGHNITVGSSNTSTLGVYTLGGSTANSSTFSGAETLNQSLTVTQVTGGTLNFTGNITSGASGTQTLKFNNVGAVSQSTGVLGGGMGTIAVTQSGTGTTTLSGANTYTGNTAVQTGQVNFTTGNASSSGVQSLGEGSTVNLGVASTSSGVLEYTGSGAATLNKTVNALGNGGDTIQNGGTGLLTLAGSLVKNGTVLTLSGGTSGIKVTGVISGTNGALHNSDLDITSGTTTLATLATYDGPTNIFSGGVLINGVSGGALPTSTTINIGSGATGGTFDLGGFNQTVAGLNTSGSLLGSDIVTNSGVSSPATLTVSNGGTFGGIIQDGTSSTALTVTGGTLALTGTSSNTYTGLTSVTNGELDLGKTGATAVAGNLTIGDGTGSADTAIVKLTGTGGNQIADGSAVSINTDGQLDLNNKTETVASLTSTGGDIVSSTAGGNLTSAGAVAFSSAGNRIGTGATVTSSTAATLTSGDLNVNGTLSDSLTMSSGTALSGTGTVGAVSLAGTNSLSSTGTLTTGNVTADSTGNQITGGVISSATATINAGGVMTVNSGATWKSTGFVDNGTLVLASPSSTLGSTSGALTVNAGAILAGTGTSNTNTFSLTGNSSTRADILVGHTIGSTNTTGVMDLEATNASSIGAAKLEFNLSATTAHQSNVLDVGTTPISFNTIGSLNVTLALDIIGGTITTPTTFLLIDGTGTTITGDTSTPTPTTGQFTGFDTFVNYAGRDQITGLNLGFYFADGSYAPSYLYVEDNRIYVAVQPDGTPEPSVWSLMIVSFGVFACWRRRKTLRD